MSQLLISADGKEWGAALKISKGHPFDVRYKVILDGERRLRVELPVYDPTDKKSISKELALMDAADWSAAFIGPNPDAEITKSDTGYCVINVKGAPAEIVFQLARDGAPSFQDKVLRATCNLRTQDPNTHKWKPAPVGSVDIALDDKDTPPFIARFSAERSVLPSGGETRLSWSVRDANHIKLVNATAATSFDNVSAEGNYFTGKLLGDCVFLLEAAKDVKDYSQKSLTIKVFRGTDIAVHAEAFKEASEKESVPERKLMNLYAYGEKIYALVLEEDTQDVFTWESSDGLSWSKSYVNSRYITFTNNQNQDAVPLAFAGSPSVVYRDKVYLIGGSRYDGNIRSNDVYFYDYNELDKGWQKLAPASGASSMFTPRMGHACLVYKNQIWLLGGCTDFGAQSDIWTFDGDHWEKINLQLPERRAMFSAIEYGGRIQIFGGVDYLPGDATKDITDSYELQDGNRWVRIPWDQDIDKTRYVACEVAVVQNERFIFSVLEDRGSYLYRCDQVVNDKLLRIKSDGAWLFPDAVLRIQAVAFKDLLWLCTVMQNEGIQSQALHYLAYVKA